MKDLKCISDTDLVHALKSLVSSEREVLCEVVNYLREVDARRLYLELGYSSLFVFVTKGLGYSGGAGYRRIQAARCMAETPEALEKLRTGEISLCALVELSKVSQDKRAEVMLQSVGKSKEAVRQIVAKEVSSPSRPREKVVVSAAPLTPLFEAAPKAESRGEELYTVTLTLTADEYRLLQEVQAICSERVKSRAVVRSLKLYRRLRSPHELRRKRAQEKVTFTVKVEDPASLPPASPPPATVTRHIPSEVRDQVLMRDEGRCTFVGKEGHRCAEAAHVHLDHIRPFSIGGGHSEENLQVLCPTHNNFVYERFLASNAGKST